MRALYAVWFLLGARGVLTLLAWAPGANRAVLHTNDDQASLIGGSALGMLGLAVLVATPFALRYVQPRIARTVPWWLNLVEAIGWAALTPAAFLLLFRITNYTAPTSAALLASIAIGIAGMGRIVFEIDWRIARLPDPDGADMLATTGGAPTYPHPVAADRPLNGYEAAPTSGPPPTRRIPEPGQVWWATVPDHGSDRTEGRWVLVVALNPSFATVLAFAEPHELHPGANCVEARAGLIDGGQPLWLYLDRPVPLDFSVFHRFVARPDDQWLQLVRARFQDMNGSTR